MSFKFNLETLLHDLIAFGIVAASIFVKNPASQAHAAQIISIVQNDLLPLIDPATGKALTPGS